jgi:hypothetical protein
MICLVLIGGKFTVVKRNATPLMKVKMIGGSETPFVAIVKRNEHVQGLENVVTKD